MARGLASKTQCCQNWRPSSAVAHRFVRDSAASLTSHDSKVFTSALFIPTLVIAIDAYPHDRHVHCNARPIVPSVVAISVIHWQRAVHILSFETSNVSG